MFRFILWLTRQNELIKLPCDAKTKRRRQNELIKLNCDAKTKRRKMNVNKVANWFIKLCVYFLLNQ